MCTHFLKRLALCLLAAAALLGGASARAQGAQAPNILVIFGDDIGLWNLSAYSRGAMGYRTPNIDRIGKEGAIFSDHYAQPSCTAGRAAFITGQLPIRTGLTTVGLVGANQGLQPANATLAEVLKTRGYATGQFGKNHLGDRNEHLPTVHGFDEFFGNLYHLNTEEEPEDEDYPTDPGFKKRHGPRGVLHCTARKDANPETPADPRFGPWGAQNCQDTGPLTRKRMETADGEFVAATLRFIERAKADKKPFFAWLNTTRMHTFTRVPQDYLKRCRSLTSAADPHCAGMLQHDEEVGGLLDRLKALGLEQNTIVVYTTDNGPEHSTWPHGATTPYKGEKMTTWEGGVRVPMLLRWPGRVAPGTELNGIQSHEDLFTSLATAAGAVDIVARLAKGDALGTAVVKKSFIDGVDNTRYWSGAAPESARQSLFYYEESALRAVRLNQWKIHFGSRSGYYGTSTSYPLPLLVNLRQDPFESYLQAPGPRAEITQHKSYMFNMVLEALHQHIGSLQAYPPTQKAASLDVNQIIQSLVSGSKKQ
jgi:arylsulfatase A-like enzyme